MKIYVSFESVATAYDRDGKHEYDIGVNSDYGGCGNHNYDWR